MKLGGNSAAGAALGARVGMTPASAAKYDSRAARDYKKRLSEKVQTDVRRNPENPFAEDSQLAAEDEADKFVDAKSVESLSDLTESTNGKKTLVTEEDGGFRHQSPVSSPSITGLPPRKPVIKTGKLGAVKTNVSFDQLEAKAREEQKAKEVVAPKEEPVKSAAPIAPSAAKKAPPQAPQVSKEQQAAMERLGMGMRKMNLSQAPQAKETTYTPSPSASTQKKVTGLKSMSSDQYFKGDNHEENYANQERLRNIQGATSVSSGQFFNPDDEEPYEGGGGAAGILSRIKTFVDKEFLGSDEDDFDSASQEDRGDGSGYARLPT
ncbi:hypothetical protein PSACC_00878 [Paramicrosporidium saccamoebae]|uniref:Uncharacterized protein n=1 Tax=Paramicrosporidium saccamoebae TaxID=1246581 RepID=A0A2H9TNN1_9FUNG|nr:hypothetical protein PSACC_00878 [Paramicrosporidium saccamoebae]